MTLGASPRAQASRGPYGRPPGSPGPDHPGTRQAGTVRPQQPPPSCTRGRRPHPRREPSGPTALHETRGRGRLCLPTRPRGGLCGRASAAAPRPHRPSRQRKDGPLPSWRRAGARRERRAAMDDTWRSPPVSQSAMLTRETVDRRRRLLHELGAELERRGWHASDRGLQMWVTPVFLQPGHEVTLDDYVFLWCAGSFIGDAIGSVHDIPGAADKIQDELSARARGELPLWT